MKILCFSDVHFKYLSPIPVFNRLENNVTIELNRALNSIDFVIDIINQEKPDLVVLLGDVWHSLTNNMNILIALSVQKMKELYDTAKQNQSKLYILNGNHDYIAENISMIDTLPADKIIKQPYQEDEFYFLPFFEPEFMMISQLQSLQYKSDIKYIFTHASITGFNFNRQKTIESGAMISEDIDKMVISGHIHIPQRKGNVVYVGALYQNTLSEKPIDIENGVVILDTETNEVRWIENNKVGYIDSVYLSNPDKLEEMDFSRIDAIKLVIDVDDNELLEDVKVFLEEEGVLYYTQKVVKKVERQVSVIDYSVSPNEVMSMYVKQKYPELDEVFGKYFKVDKVDKSVSIYSEVKEIIEEEKNLLQRLSD